jgi:hypothetical protein
MERHNQIDHVLIDRRRHSSILYVRSFRVTDFDSDHYLVHTKVSERLAVSKRMLNKMGMERFDLKKLLKNSIRLQSKKSLQPRKA